MKIAYASRTGNVESIVQSLGISSVFIENGNETMDTDYVLFTYTDGYGDVPAEVETFYNFSRISLMAITSLSVPLFSTLYRHGTSYVSAILSPARQ